MGGHRLYATVVAVLVFFVSWAAFAARPWAAKEQDPRLAALALREQRLRADARVVQRIVAQRNAAYEAALTKRRAQIAEAQARSLQAGQGVAAAVPTRVRVVQLPPLTTTSSS